MCNENIEVLQPFPYALIYFLVVDHPISMHEQVSKPGSGRQLGSQLLGYDAFTFLR